VFESHDEPVTVLFPRHSLASALAAGLTAMKWRVHGDTTDGPGSRVVLAADDHGRLPLRAAAALPHGPRHLVLVGGLACLRELADGMRLGASAAVNADLPFAELLPRVDAALRAGPTPADARERLRARLREREAESGRFELLTDREAAVLVDLARGLAASEIARRRPVALATVRSQIAEILRKLEVPSQTAAVALTHHACRDGRVVHPLRVHQNYG
jgi:DNA-binding NarL/FixJ family response regulator